MVGKVTRWTVSVSEETDSNLRTHLAQRGMKKGDFSRFIEDAVKWRLLDLSLADARTGFEDMPIDEPNDLIKEAIADTRKH